MVLGSFESVSERLKLHNSPQAEGLEALFSIRHNRLHFIRELQEGGEQRCTVIYTPVDLVNAAHRALLQVLELQAQCDLTKTQLEVAFSLSSPSSSSSSGGGLTVFCAGFLLQANYTLTAFLLANA